MELPLLVVCSSTASSFFVRPERRFSVPACTTILRRAERRSRLAAGHRRRRREAVLTAASTAQCSIRLGATVLPGHGSFRGLVSAATWHRGGRHLYVPNVVTTRGPRRRKRGCRASSRLGQAPASIRRISIGRRTGRTGLCGGRGVAPVKVAIVLPDAVHDDGELAGNGHRGAAHADPPGKRQTPCLEL
jgi:hypothetical protein